MSTKPKTIPLSLRKKSSARLAVVQCLYRIKMNNENLTSEEWYEEYTEQWNEDKASANRALSYEVPPDKTLFLKLIESVSEHAESIDASIKTLLSAKWKLERMSPVLVAILECAIAELKYLEKLKPAVIINEYVTLTGRFFEPDEAGFVNGLLDSLAKK